MAKVTHKAILKILQDGKFEQLKGLVENEFLDVKKLPYDCDGSNKITDEGKFELAKDVSSFANSKGGIIIIGVSTEQPDLESTKESINGFTNLSSSAINERSYKDILNRLTYPKLGERVQIAKFKLPSGYLFAIFIPYQPKDKYFIVSGILERTHLSIGRFVGIFRRQGDNSSSFLSTPEIYSALKKDSKTKMLIENVAKEFKTLHGRMDDLTSLVKQMGMSKKEIEREADATKNIEVVDNLSVSDNLDIERSVDRIENAISEGDFAGQPVLLLSCTYKGDKPIQVPNLFNPVEKSPYKLVENPPAFREFGWDLKTLDQPKSIEGDCLQVRNGDRKLLRVYRDGQIIFIALAKETFLGWGTKDRNVWGSTSEDVPADAIILNALAVAEVITNFAQFIELLRIHLLPVPQNINIEVQVRNPGEKIMKLLWASMFNNLNGEFSKNIKSKELKFHFVDTLDIDFKKIAADLFKEFCYVFGLTDQNIKYLVENEGKTSIDMDKFKNK